MIRILENVYNTLNSTNYYGITILVFIFIVIIAYFYINQRKFIYSTGKGKMSKSPKDNKFPLRNPGQQNLNYQQIHVINSQGTKLNGWHIKPNTTSKRIVVFYQGAGRYNMGSKLPFLKKLIDDTDSQIIYIVYRGYSDNQGQPTQKGICEDGEVIMDYAIKYQKQKAPHLNLYVFGKSLGGGVAIHVCSQKKFKEQIRGIILQNTFTSMLDIVTHFFPLRKCVSLFLKDHWLSKQKIGSIAVPFLFIRGLQDKLINPKQMIQLRQIAKEKSQIVLDHPVPEGKHDKMWKVRTTDYIQAINNFFNHPKIK